MLEFPNIIKYKILNVKHPEYQYNYLKKINLLREGGDELIDNARIFIPQLPQEDNVVYEARLKSATYYNHLAEILNDYNYPLFSKTLSVLPASDADDPSTPGIQLDPIFEDFFSNCDRPNNKTGKSLNQFLQTVFPDTLADGRHFVLCDFAQYPDLELDNQQEKEIGLGRPYLVDIPTHEAINWKYDDNGNFEYFFQRQEYCDDVFLEETKSYTVRFIVRCKDPDSLYSQWGIYEKKYDYDGAPPNDADDYTLVGDGITSFPYVPVKAIFLPNGLCIGKSAILPIIEIFKLETSLIFSETRSLYEFPFYTDGDPTKGLNINGTGPNKSVNSVRQEMMNKGIVCGGFGSKLEFVGPSGKTFELLQNQITQKVHQLKQSVLQNAAITAKQNTSTLSSTSGISKMVDHQSQEMILEALGQIVQEFAVSIVQSFLEAMPGNEKVILQASGLSDYQIFDQAQLSSQITMSPLLKQLIPSPTYWKNYLMELVRGTSPDLHPDTLKEIQDEINKNVPTDTESLLNNDIYSPPDQNEEQPTKEDK